MGCGASSETGHRHPNNTYITREDLDAASERYLEGAEPSLHASPWDSELVAPDTRGAVDDEEDLKALDDRQRQRGGSIGAECDEPSTMMLAARHTVAVMTARFHGIDDSVPPPPAAEHDPDAVPVDTNRMNCWVDDASHHLPHHVPDEGTPAGPLSSAAGSEQYLASATSDQSHASDDASEANRAPLTSYTLRVFLVTMKQADIAVM